MPLLFFHSIPVAAHPATCAGKPFGPLLHWSEWRMPLTTEMSSHLCLSNWPQLMQLPRVPPEGGAIHQSGQLVHSSHAGPAVGHFGPDASASASGSSGRTHHFATRLASFESSSSQGMWPPAVRLEMLGLSCAYPGRVAVAYRLIGHLGGHTLRDCRDEATEGVNAVMLTIFECESTGEWPK
ncbi:unnamed protein product [Protopolystoma xenopodis]|uniref:Uncharacterized protein n=1 Tax=Protopolystoma xenopodis TaxID=117903 RepID=A0A3S5B6F0_9PLAT|nr:unnamed protein product [Protopolystoma xenopodis]